jgi:hypothetical protein
MASDFDPADFVDSDFQAQKLRQTTSGGAANSGSSLRAPSREEVESRVSDAQQKLVELKRAQEALERERAMLEETRRRQTEFQTGRQEMVQSLTRGVGLLEEAEFASRRDAEQMSKTLADFRDALSKIQSVHEETWTKDTFEAELTRALTIVENARMEWNSARLKLPVLSGSNTPAPQATTFERSPQPADFSTHSFLQLCKLGLAFTWPLTLIALAAFAVLLFKLFGYR